MHLGITKKKSKNMGRLARKQREKKQQQFVINFLPLAGILYGKRPFCSCFFGFSDSS
jgi:hypothetical protein